MFIVLFSHSSDNDDQLKDRSDYIQSQASSGEWARCRNIVKDILCQRCSPYSAGIFEGVSVQNYRYSFFYMFSFTIPVWKLSSFLKTLWVN